MSDANDRDREMNQALFLNLVMMLASSAMHQMGKLVNPATGKAQANLEAAQITIDMLGMLEERTRGNLSADESRMLGETLATLRMNYVETVEAQRSAPATPASAAPDGETPPGPASEPQATASAPEPPPPDSQKREPKFRKSYG